MKKWLSEFIEDESGQGMVEYALIVALIAIVAMVGFVSIGEVTNTTLADSSEKINAI